MNHRKHANRGVARWAIAFAMLAPVTAGQAAEEAVQRTEASSVVAQQSSRQERGLDTIQRLRSDLEEARVQIDALRQEIRMLGGGFQARFHRFMDRRWHNVTANRQQGVHYTNDFDVPIEVSVVGDRPGQNGCMANVIVDRHQVALSYNWNFNSDKHCFAAATVPPGSTYWADMRSGYGGNHAIHSWHELRPVQ